eukprot:GEMP01033631.1.p1 GENE.GEMP01033631.1~~GEMP01033631.1.p1  ORF type:complete len:219 (+),score=51.88 GEMP01033631.1:1221-1877(+)
MKTGQVKTWAYDNMCEYVDTVPGTNKRILNVGSGPFTPRSLECDGQSHPIISADGLAKYYLGLYDELGLDPPGIRYPMQCAVEDLSECFPQNYFHVTHMRNALDHTFDPLVGLEQMLAVTKPGGIVILRHAENEGVAGKFRVGLHQWAFTVKQHSDGPHFVMWNPELEVDVTTFLRDRHDVESTVTELRPHPQKVHKMPVDEIEDFFVFCDIRKKVFY